MRDIRGRHICTPKGTNVSSKDAGPSEFVSVCDQPPPELTPVSSTRIKRRSAFVKHVKAKHGVVDMSKMSIEEAAAAADLIRDLPDVGKATPPPDYTTAAKARMYREEDLPTFPLGAMPKEEAYTPPPSVDTPPPGVIDILPSSGGYRWSSANFIGSCFHPCIKCFTLPLTGQTVHRPYNAWHWYPMCFPRFGAAGWLATLPSNSGARSQWLLLFPYFPTPCILRTTMVQDSNPGSFRRSGRRLYLLPIAMRFGHGLQFDLRPNHLRRFQLPIVILEGWHRYARLYDPYSSQLTFALSFRVTDVQIFFVPTPHSSRCGRGVVSLTSLACMLLTTHSTCTLRTAL